MLGRFSLSTRFLMILGIPLVFQVVLFTLLARVQSEAAVETSKLINPIAVNTQLSAAFRDLLEMYLRVGRFHPGFFLSPEFEELRRDALDKLAELKVSLKDDPKSVKVLERTEREYEELRDLAESAKGKFLEGGLESLNLVEQKEILTKAAAGLSRMEDEMTGVPKVIEKQAEIAAQTVPAWRDADRRYGLILEGGIAVEFILIAASFLWFARGVTSRLTVIVDNGYRLASRQSLNQPVSGEDEIARVDSAFHAAAGALLKSERREHTVAANARDMICSLQEKLFFVEVNQAASAVLGYAPEELLHMKLVRLVMAADVALVIKKLEQCKADGSGVFECRMVRRDEEVLETRWSVQYLQEKESFFCVIHDNTERKRAENLRREVLQMVSHDLKTPLNTLSNVLELASTGALGQISERGQALGNIAAFATEQMLTLINDLLDMEKIEAGMLQVSPVKQPVKPLVDQSLYAVSGLAVKSAVEVVSTLESESEAVYADGDRVVQVLTNLLSNAVKFSPEGGKVEASVARKGDWVEFSVRDNGRGIPADALPFIFDRFRQVEIEDATHKGGSGLGLAICKSLVSMHGGTIEAVSEVGKGTTMRFTLKADQPAEEIST